MSFLQRLKSRGVVDEKAIMSMNDTEVEIKPARLNVDVFQTSKSVVIYAQAAGAGISDVEISIEGKADIVVINGNRTRPEQIAFPLGEPEGAFISEECLWGGFERRIFLPVAVDLKHAEAKIKNGVLVLTLPLLE